MPISIMTKIVRRILVGKEQKFAFIKNENIEFPRIEKIGLYIHIPFCKNLCPYCPYNRIAYDKNLATP
ncbi:MAG: coproporphyrinogen-III oxidase family protein, partial [Alphaproteobacteria bacterium]